MISSENAGYPHGVAYHLPINSRFGPFLILTPLGSGGMGSVYRVRWEAQGVDAALKVVQPGQKEEALKRFRREIAATAGLAHPGIVRVLDYGELQGAPYYVMEYLDCPTLANLIDEASSRGTAVMDLQTFAGLFRSLLKALGYAHARRVIHRDIKPANVFLRKTGEAVLADFGVAFVVDGTALTASGNAVGTPTHMAPEQIRGGTIDTRTDVYQVGLLMYEVLTGSLPFMDEDGAFGVALARMTRAIPPPSVANPTAPPELDRVILRCLAVPQEARYPDTASLANDLEAAIQGRAVGTVGTLAAVAPDARLEALRPAPVRAAPPRAPARPAATSAVRLSWQRTLLLVTLLNVAGFGALYMLLGTRSSASAAREVRIEPGADRATIAFATSAPVAASIEFGSGQAPDRIASAQGSPRTAHRIELEGLSPGQDYVFRIVTQGPDGKLHPGALLSFRTLSTAADPAPSAHRAIDVKLRTGREELEVSFRTTRPLKSRLLLSGPGGKRDLPVATAAATEHHLLVHELAPGSRYSFRIVLLPDDAAPLHSLEQTVETSK